MFKFPVLLALACSVVAQHAVASQADVDAELTALIAEFQAQKTPINVFVNRIKWMGLSDSRLFDPMRDELLANYQKSRSWDAEQRYSWLVQALAFSGQSAYRSAIETVMAKTTSKKQQRHAQSALEVLPTYARWNPVISSGLASVPPDRFAKQRVINMLQAPYPELARAGSSFVLDNYLQDAEMLGVVEQQLRVRHPRVGNDLEAAEAVSWMCKVLGETGNAQYLPLLEQVKAAAIQPAVQRWSGKAISAIKHPKAGKRP